MSNHFRFKRTLTAAALAAAVISTSGVVVAAEVKPGTVPAAKPATPSPAGPPANNQVIQSAIEMVSQARENDPMTFLTGLGNLSRDFQISYAVPNQDVAGNYVLDMRPRRSTALINRMVIVVDRAAAQASAANSGVLIFPILSSVYDPNGNSTTIEFSDIRVNRGISAGQFNFIMPPGVEVVRPTGKEMGF